MPTPNCPNPARLRELLDGSIPETEQAVLTAHLETCAACQQAVEGLVAGRDTWVGAARQLGAGAAPLDPVLQSAMDEARHALPGIEPSPEADAPVELPRDFLGPPDEPGHLGKLSHYEVIDVVGRGAMGIVLRAFDQKLHRVVAIKVMSPQLASSASARKRFIREGQAAAAVCHEHVVTIHAVEEAHGLPYLVMQYVGGVSLQDRLDTSGPLELREILRIGMQAAEGLAAAHAQGLVHRDIKPSNILLENGVERVKITDFGLARAVDDASLTQTGVIAGTPQYMAPEQAHGAALDHRADLFSLGSVLYALCAGRPPFRSSTMMAVLKRVCEETPRPIREINPDIPDWLAAIISRLHAKNPTDRFQSAREVAELLGQHLAHLQRPNLMPRPLATPSSMATVAQLPVPARAAPATDSTAAASVELWYPARLLTAGILLVPATASFVAARGASHLVIPIQLLGAVVLLIAMLHAIVVRLFTRSWHGSIAGLLIDNTAAGTADDRAGASGLRTQANLLLIVCLLGAAASFVIPSWVQQFWLHPQAIGLMTGLGWLLLSLGLFRSSFVLRRGRRGNDGSLRGRPPESASRPAAPVVPGRGSTLQRAMMMAVTAVCVMIVLVPIVLAAAIGVSWMAYSRRAVPQTSRPHVPAAVEPAETDLPVFTTSLWNGSDVERALLGRWIVVSQETRGASVPDEARIQWLQFGSVGDTNRFAESSHSGQLTIARYFVDEIFRGGPAAKRLDDEGRLSKVIVSDDTETELRHGVFRIEGDTLSLCLASTEDPAPQSLGTDAGNSAVLYVLKRDKPAKTTAAGYPRDSIAGEWRSDLGDVTFEHEPVQNNAPVNVKGWLVWKTSRTRTRFEGTFDPPKELVELTFEKESSPDLHRGGQLKLTVDGDKLVGFYVESFANDVKEGSERKRWELTRKPKLADVPASSDAQDEPQ